MDEIDKVGFISLFVTPNDPMNSHKFIPQSACCYQADLKNESDTVNEHSSNLIPEDSNHGSNRGGFFFPDVSGEGSAAFLTAQGIAASELCTSSLISMRACGKKLAKVLHFYYNLPTDIRRARKQSGAICDVAIRAFAVSTGNRLCSARRLGG